MAKWNEMELQPGMYSRHFGEHRSDTVDIPVPAKGELEYMLNMKTGGSIVYSWRALDMASPEKLTSEFHGHNEPSADKPGDLIFYRKAVGDTESGAMTAPFDGAHGWYLKNESDAPVTVRLTVAGFYELIPGQIK